MRPIRLVCTGLLMAVLAGCATAISGHGQPVSPTATATTTPASPTPTPSPTATPRVAAHDLGDPRSADLCTLVRPHTYRAFGTATVDTVQTAAMCFVTVTARNKHQIGLTLTAMPAKQARSRNLVRPTTRRRSSGGQERRRGRRAVPAGADRAASRSEAVQRARRGCRSGP